MKNIFQKIAYHARTMNYAYVSYGWLQLISNPIFYLTWVYFDKQGYENLGIRIGINLLAIPLVFANRWPQKYQYYLPFYWYAAAVYTLPFFFTFMLLKNQLSFGWSLNVLTGIVLSLFLLDLVAFSIVFLIGVPLAIFIFYLTTPTPEIIIPSYYKTIIITYAIVIIFGAIFSHRKDKMHREKINVMQSLAASLAHELRTPLAAIKAGSSVLSDYFPLLFKIYKQAEQNHLNIVPEINENELQKLKKVLIHIEKETEHANNAISMLLMNVRQFEINENEFTVCSISHGINEALHRYPFLENDIQLIHLKIEKDFLFHGNELLTIHVLFNLIKNAIYYIRVARKGKIDIWLSSNAKWNFLHFRDSATGIEPEILPHIFDRFFSKTTHGSGVGLAFCKMVLQSYRGDISCHSVSGEFTEFILKFPKII